MREKFKRKLGTTKKGNRTKKALSPDELNALLIRLQNDTSVHEGKEVNETVNGVLLSQSWSPHDYACVRKH
jgi:hypothetical protein